MKLIFKKGFNKQEKELGSDYEIFRLKKDGKLDKDFDNPWNLVAINKTSIFKNCMN